MVDVSPPLPPLPLDHVVVVQGWPGERSLLRPGWTGIASDRVCVYHLPVGPGAEPSVETTTYRDGQWVDVQTLDFMLTSRARAQGELVEHERVINVDGVAHPFRIAARGATWAAVSADLAPVVTVLANGVPSQGLALVTVNAAEIDGHGQIRCRLNRADRDHADPAPSALIRRCRCLDGGGELTP